MTFSRSLGGEFELTPADFAPGQNGASMPHFGRDAILGCNTGRSALRLALRDWLDRGGSSVVWLPDYICPSVRAACRAEGCRIETFGDLPDAQQLTRPPVPAKGDAVLCVHYFGCINRNFMTWLNLLSSNRDWTLIEDCVQSAYSKGVGGRGDYAIVSLRKWWAVPDGAAVISDRPLSVCLPEAGEAFVNMRTAAKLLRGCGRAAGEFLELVEHSEALLDTASPCKMSWLSTHLLARCDAAAMTAARRDNWQQVAAAMAPGSSLTEKVAPLFMSLRDNEVPLGFPVRVLDNRRNALQTWLRTRRIYCPIHWAIAPAPGISMQAITLANEILTLPIDQRYRAEDMERLVAALREFFEFV